MPKTLLDLTDELIQLVAFYVHTDNFIPLPSFHPHHFNWASEIDSNVQKDYMNLRLTCRRVRDLCLPKGLHVVLKNWKKLVEWTMKAPDSILTGVRRVEIDIQFQPNLRISYAWPVIVHFLGLLTDLEELILVRTPLCTHSPTSIRQATGERLSELRTPSHDFLGRLMSFAISDRCPSCALPHINLLLPSMPSIKFVKTAGWSLPEKGINLWLNRHASSGGMVHVTTLFWKLRSLVFPYLDSGNYLLRLKELLPELEIVVLSINDFKSDNGVHFRAGPGPTDNETWRLGFELFEDFRSDFVTFRSRALEDDWPCLLGLLKSLGNLPNLKTMDLLATFSIKDRRPHLEGFTRKRKWSERGASPTTFQKFTQHYEDKLRSAICVAAMPFLEHIPSLQTGYFWEPYGLIDVQGEMDVTEWYRWEYHRVTEDDGTCSVEVVTTPERLSSEFMTTS
ncbi:hypothetical protein I302_108263 [Kwoniella bestiolae CBS 10118]|uniref:Uncharacterized protein n=1 Tax=Kwoniella bestiolae CBS 10118 TaxID=1296100 RepID=A0A1B9FW91_9TREE|nr:hypothetical protein I302_07371 [Kwoniella bestiolae CBS 10118]OCF23021.1 hypothetical protein I302_07371 [Kwoniella bestiolae CBS 10118]